MSTKSLTKERMTCLSQVWLKTSKLSYPTLISIRVKPLSNIIRLLLSTLVFCILLMIAML